jgi:hypothetical protein
MSCGVQRTLDALRIGSDDELLAWQQHILHRDALL